MKVFWLRLYPKDTAGNEIEYLFTTRNHKQAVNITPGKTYLPFLENYPTLEISVFQGEFTGRAEVRCDNLIISQGPADLLSWPNLIWDGARAQLLKGYDNTNSISDAANMIFSGLVDKAPEFSEDSVNIKLTDFGENLVKEFLTLKYTGAGGVEGPVGMKGVFKPLAIGKPKGIQPILIDHANVIFQYSAYAETVGVQSLWENGLSFGPKTATVAYAGSVQATFDALKAQALTLGQWADAPSIGMFRLGGEPAQGGVITADVHGIKKANGTHISTIADVLDYLFRTAGEGARLNSANLTAFQTATGGMTISDYFLDQENINQIVQRYLRSVGGYYFFDTTGLVKFNVIRMVPPTYTISTAGNTEPVVEDMAVLPVSAPHKELRMGVDKNFRVHSTNEISDALLVRVNLASATALSAREAADLATLQVEAVETSMNQIGADGVLTRVEKQVAKNNYADLANEEVDLLNRATAFGITTEKNNYVSAFSALDTYLASLSPAWDNTTTSTTINRTTWTAKWRAVYFRRALLLTKIAEFAVLADRILDQGRLATRNDIVASMFLGYNAGNNVVHDPDYQDDQLWNVSNGGTFDVSTDTTSAALLNARRSIKTPVGNGTTTQSTVFFAFLQAGPDTALSVEPGKRYRITIPILIKAGFTGQININRRWLNSLGGQILGSVTNGPDYRTTAAAADTLTYISIVTSHPTAAFLRFLYQIVWSTTLANAGYALVGRPVVIRVPSVDGNDLHDSVGVVTQPAYRTSEGIADSVAGQGWFATQNALSLEDTTRLTNRTRIALLSSATGRIVDPRAYNTQFVIGPRNLASLTPSYTVNATDVTVTIPAHTRYIAGPSGPISLSYGQGSFNVPFSTSWMAYIDDVNMSGIASPAYNYTTNGRNLLAMNRYHAASGRSPDSGGTGGTVDSGGGGGGGTIIP